jgi:soluble lytic murein transglycosylase-like protein
MTITDQIVAEAQNQGLDPRLALEVAIAESNLDPTAVSTAGAIGVFQLMPSTAAMLGVDPTNVVQNIQGGIAYLRQMLDQFGGNVAQALAAYNWGPANVAAALSSGANWIAQAPAETRNYVSRILSALGQYTVSIQPGQILQTAAEAVAQPAAEIVGGIPASTWRTITIGAGILLGALLLAELLD